MDVLCKKKGIEPAEHWNRQRLDKLRLDAMWTDRRGQVAESSTDRYTSSRVIEMQELAVSSALSWLLLEWRCDPCIGIRRHGAGVNDTNSAGS